MILKASEVRNLTDAEALPACLTRDRLTSAYFPRLSLGATIVTVVLCALFAVVSLNRLHHTDLWGHLAFGRWMAENGRLPTVDPFAVEASLQPLVNTAWLSQLTGYEVHRRFGNDGLILGHALLALAGFAGVVASVRSRGVSLGWSATAAVAAYLLSLPITGTIRPQLFGMALFPWVLVACSQTSIQKKLPLWIVPLFALWANLHGSFLTGLIVLFAAAFAVTLRECFTADGDRALILRHWTIALLALLATTLNPHGPYLLPHVAGFGRNEILSAISEWRTISLDTRLTLSLFLPSATLGALALYFTPRRLAAYDILLFLFFALTTIVAIRMLAWWALAWPWLIVPHLEAIVRRWREGTYTTADVPEGEPTAMHTVIALGTIFTTLLLSPPAHAFIAGRERAASQTLGSGTPLYVTDETTRRNLSGNFFAPMDWADYFVWASHGQLHPLAYTHVHLLPSEAWDDYTHIAVGRDEWEQIARRRRLKYLVIPHTTTMRQLGRLAWKASTGESPTVRVIYQDQKCLMVELLPLRQRDRASSQASAFDS